MTDDAPPHISGAELALRLGVDRERVDQLAAAGALASDAEGLFNPGDVHRLRLLLAFETAGVPLDALLDASRAGAISLTYYDELHPPPGRLSDRSYAEFVASLGAGPESARRLFAAFGLAEPDVAAHLTVADEELIAMMVATAVDTGQPDLALRAVRMFGEAARRAADGALGVYGEAAARSDEELRGLPIDDLFERRLRPWARFARMSGTLAAWLMDRHISRAIDEYSVIETELVLERSGFVPSRLEVRPAVVFVDLTGFTQMTEERGDDVAAEVAMRLGEVALETVAGRGGRIVKLLGDGVLVRFDDATAAAECALDLLVALPRAGLPTAHAGLAAGPLIIREGDVFGRTVNLAARVADVTPDARLYAPEDVGADLDPERFAVTPAGQSILQGIGSLAVVDVARRTVSP
jgi:adenylate cyclase